MERMSQSAESEATPTGGAQANRADTTLVVVTGLSGGGRSTVARALENVGFYVVDNLPQALMIDMAELGVRGRRRRPADGDGPGRTVAGPSPPTWPARSGRSRSAASSPRWSSSTPTTTC